MIDDKLFERRMNDYAGWFQLLFLASLVVGGIAIWKPEWLGAVSGAFLAALFGVLTTLFTEHRKDVARRRTAATLVYLEVKDAIRIITLLRTAWSGTSLPPDLKKAPPPIVENRLLSQNAWAPCRVDLVPDLGPEYVRLLTTFYEQAQLADKTMELCSQARTLHKQQGPHVDIPLFQYWRFVKETDVIKKMEPVLHKLAELAALPSSFDD